MILMVVGDGQVQALHQLAQSLGGQRAQVVAEQRQRREQEMRARSLNWATAMASRGRGGGLRRAT
jgi:hypothetical protein